MILQVRAETIAAQDTLEYGAQQADQYFAAARGRHCVDHIPCCHKSPQEAFRAVGPPTRLVDVQHGFILQLLFQFPAGGSHRLTGFFPALLRAPQTDFDSQNLLQQGFHYPSRHAADYRQVCDQRRQLRAEVSGGLPRHGGARAFATFRTDHAVALIFNGARLDGRQFGHLMPLRLPGCLHLLDLPGQRVAAMLALIRQDGPNLVHFAKRRQRPMRPAMARLSSRLPPAFLAPAPLSRFTGQSIG